MVNVLNKHAMFLKMWNTLILYFYMLIALKIITKCIILYNNKISYD